MTPVNAALADALHDHYALERELGRGGMATVYLAHDFKHDRPVALKVLHPELAAALGPERFLREIHTTARLQHPHILPVHDSGEAGGFLYYVMPYVEGESLRDRLRRETQLPLEEALGIVREVGSALDYAHRHGVVHRDIKPENILLSDGQALVADFGVAHAFEQGTEGRLTETGLAVGTPAYMAPEQAVGGPVDARTDIYALGCVLYELLAGEPPYTGPTPQAVIAKRFADAVPSIRRVREGVPEPVERALIRSLAKAPADRHRTAAEFVRALESTMVAPAATVATPLASTAAPARGRTSRRAMLLAVAALLVSVAAIAGVLVRARETPKALDENLLVVAPFEVLSPGLELWREGMVDLLARTFDGAGALRTVSPSTAVRQWRGSADPEAAGRFARRFGARLAVFGTVVPARGDSVRLRAALLDVGRGTVVAEAEVAGGAEEMGAVSDSVAFRLLRGLGGTRPIGLVRSSSLGSRSVPALKAFLQGEQLHRAGQWEAAIEAYQTATELDTLFTLAYFHQAMVLGWRESFNDTISNTLFLRAGALNHGLAQRESLLVVAESLGAAATLDLEHPGIWRHYRRQREALEAAAGRYPSDAEVWFTLADSRYHYGVGPGLETRPTDIAAALDRALTADPAFGPAYPHRIELALQLEGPTPARRLIARYRALRPTLSEQEGMHLLDALLDPARAGSAEVERMLDTVPAEALASVVQPLTWWGDSAETYLRVARAFLRPRSVTTRQSMLHLQPRRVSNALGTRGHLREAARMPTPHEYSVVLAGQVGIVSDDSMRTAMARSTGPPFVFAGWMAARRDTAGLAALVRLADSLARVPAQGPDRRRSATIDPQATRAYLALARGDSAAALAALAAIPDTLYGPGSVRVLHAQLLAARGKDREAARVLDLTDRISFVSPARVLLQLERARVGERLGETARAVEGYQFVVTMWRHADPELQPFVAEARAGLERLTAERKP